MKYSIALTCTLITLLYVGSPAETIKKIGPSTAAKEITTTHNTKKTFPSLTTGNVVLGIGSMALFSTGGGETHDGDDSIEINPFSQLSLEVILYKGFGMGLNGKFQYRTQKTSQSFGLINLGVSTTHLAWGIGPSLVYYYHANSRLYPYAKFCFSYGESTDTLPQIKQKIRTKKMEFAISAGINYMLTGNLGIYGEASHVRDIIDGSGGKKNGYYTTFDLGLKLFF